MSEWNLVLIAVWKIAVVFVFAMIYIIGGRTAKWMRRWVGGTFLAVNLNFLAWLGGHWGPFLGVSAFGIYGALSMGYGGDDLAVKLRRRAFYGFGLAAYAILIGFASHRLILACFQAVLSVAANVFLGVLNPAESAVDEEALIAILSVIMIPFMV